MKFDTSSIPTPPTPQQLTELNDVLVSATELSQLYINLSRHPRISSTPGSSELFEACREQVTQDMAVLDEQLENLQLLARSAPAQVEHEVSETSPAYGDDHDAPRFHSFPDVEPSEVSDSIFAAVKKAFHLEDFLRQQLAFSLASAQERKHLKLELQLKMIILSADQRCHLLEERYGFARSKSVLVQGLRRQTTRFLSKINGEKRNDID
jgi:hypothetical protein